MSKVSPSATLKISNISNELKKQGHNIINFGIGEPDLNVPKVVIKTANDFLKKGKVRYTQVSGIMELKDAIIEKYERENNLHYKRENVVVSNGAKHSLFNIMFSLLNKNDEVILIAPYWLSYIEMLRMCEAKIKIIETKKENNFKVLRQDLENAITERTKLLIFNSPNNPTGAVYSRLELQEIAKVIEKQHCYVISDEIYENYTYDAPHICFASVNEKLFDRVIVVNGVSKTYAMTGFRLGYMVGNEDLMRHISSLQSHTTSSACTISQYASVTALKHCDEYKKKTNKIFLQRRNLVFELLQDLCDIEFNKPEGAFYYFLDISKVLKKGKLKSADDFCEQLLYNQNVVLVPCAAFGEPNFVRLSYALSEKEIIEGIEKINKFINSLY